MKINTVLFDFDGTLIDTNQVIMESWQHTFETLEVKAPPREEIIKTFGELLPTSMKKFFPHVPVEESAGIYRSYQNEKYDGLITMCPGMKELVTKLKALGYKTGVVTSRASRTTLLGLEKYGVKAYFDAIITSDDTDKHKPDPAPLQIAMERLGSGPGETLFIGDTMFDILCAANAGVKSVLVDWSIAVDEKNRKGPEGPDFIMKDTEDFFRIVDSIQ